MNNIDYSPHQNRLPMHRQYLSEIIERLDKKHFEIIQGPRQSGKTTVLKQVMDVLKEGGISCTYIDLEDPAVRAEVDEHPENLLQYTSFGEGQDKRYFICLDEIQYAAQPSRMLKYLYDRYLPRLKIIATGSSSFYIDQKFTDSLVGRKRLIRTGTLSFAEFLSFSGKEALADEFEAMQRSVRRKSTHRPQLVQAFGDYLVYGGYPEVVLAKDPKEKRSILRDFAVSMVPKDLVESTASDPAKYDRLLRLLAAENGGLLNVQALSNALKVSRNELENMIYVARKSFIIETLTPFYKSFRKELTKMPKCYFLDTGLRNYFVNDFRPLDQRQDRGILLENHVFRHLWAARDPHQVHFWRTADAHEVDFVDKVHPDSGRAVEVKYDGSRRLGKGQKRFAEHYEKFPLIKVCLENVGEDDTDIFNFK